MYCDIWYGLDQQILNDVCPLLAEILGPAQSAKGQLLIGTGRVVRAFLFLVSFVTQNQMYIRRATLHLICWQHKLLY